MAQLYLSAADPDFFDRVQFIYGTASFDYYIADDGGEPALHMVANAGNRVNALYVPETGLLTDMEVVARYRTLNNGSTYPGGVAVRVDNAGLGRQAYALSPRAGVRGIWVTRYNNNGDSILSVLSGDAGSPTAYHWTRLRVTGSNLKARTWSLGDEEPVAWRHDFTNTVIETGYAGFFLFESGGTANGIRFLDLGIGTDGDPAPTEPVGGGPPPRRRPLLWVPY